jgi:hypothetical protein
MNKKQLLVVSGCCLLTGIVTRWLVLGMHRNDFHEAIDVHAYRPAFEEFLKEKDLADGEAVSGENLPGRLRKMGIVNVYRNGRFVYFVLPPTSFLADDATSEFVWQRDNGGRAIEDILQTTRRTTYHIHHFNSAPGWYFWLHN